MRQIHLLYHDLLRKMNPQKYLSLIGILKKNTPMARIFIGSTAALLIGAVSQALGFVVLAHYLGTVAFGHLMVITSVAALASTWCGFCPGEMLRRQISRDPSLFSAALGHGLVMIFATGVVLTIISILGLMLFVPAEFDPIDYLKILVLLVPSNIVLSSYLNLTEQVFLAHGDVLRANIVNSGFGIARAVTPVVACVFFGVSDLASWAVWHAGLYLVICLVHATATWRYGTPRWDPRWGLLKNQLSLGINISLSGFLIALRANVDVLVLQAVATPHLVGVYGVARRIVGTALIVPGSFDRLIYGKLAKAGKSGPLATLDLAKRYLVYSVGISAMTSASLFIIAPYVPWLFGSDFTGATGFVRILCWSVISTAIQFLAFDALNAADQHKFATIISGSTNVVGAAMVVWLGTAYGPLGIFASLYLSDMARGAALWLALTVLGRRQGQLKAPVSAAD
jgi:O-antigen/teichoic acid export membrane protein